MISIFEEHIFEKGWGQNHQLEKDQVKDFLTLLILSIKNFPYSDIKRPKPKKGRYVWNSGWSESITHPTQKNICPNEDKCLLTCSFWMKKMLKSFSSLTFWGMALPCVTLGAGPSFHGAEPSRAKPFKVTKVPVFSVWNCPSFAGDQTLMQKSMANLRDFPLNSAFVWVGNVLTTVSSFMLLVSCIWCGIATKTWICCWSPFWMPNILANKNPYQESLLRIPINHYPPGN